MGGWALLGNRTPGTDESQPFMLRSRKTPLSPHKPRPFSLTETCPLPLTNPAFFHSKATPPLIGPCPLLSPTLFTELSP